jgi:hypothetical protein
MKDILLSHPLIQLYLVYAGALLLVFFWRRPSNLPAREGDGRRGVPQPGSRFRQEKIGRELPFVRELGESCAAEYTARYSSAIKRIRKSEKPLSDSCPR